MTAKKHFAENGVLGFLFAGPEKQIFFDPEAPPTSQGICSCLCVLKETVGATRASWWGKS